MKIISKFQDYYDNMKCYANPNYCSDDFTFKRSTKYEYMDPPDYFSILIKEGTSCKRQISQQLIGFCGNWYIMYSAKSSDNYYNSQNLHNNYTFYPTITAALKDNLDMRYLIKQFNTRNLTSTVLRKHVQSSFTKTLEKLYTHWEQKQKTKLQEISTQLNNLNLFEKYNTPTLAIQTINNNPARSPCDFVSFRQVYITINPNLEQLSFYKLIDGNLAYQEIEMYLGSELLPQDNPNQITDNTIKIQNHGFDNITSFRSGLSKKEKREKRKQNKQRKQNAQKTS